MKKLLIFMLVLGLASWANGTMLSYEYAGGGTDVPEFTVITINIRGDVAADDFIVTTAITGDFSNVALGTVNSGFDDELTDPGTLLDGLVDNVWILLTTGINLSASPSVPATEVFATFTLTTGSAGASTITLDDYAGVLPPPTNSQINATEVDMEPLELNIIPEPATMALLGLGSLFLMRRRK